MKIFDILNKLEEQKKFYASKGLLAEASALETTAKKIKDHIDKEILSKKEAKLAWANTDSDVSGYLDKIIQLVAQLSSLSKEEIEEDYDVEKIKKIYYLIHNTNRRLMKVANGFNSSAVDNLGKNSDLYRFLRDYIQFMNPESLSEFEAFYADKKDNKYINKISIESFMAAAAEKTIIPNFTQWLHEKINKTISISTLEELAAFKGGGKGPNRGNYEMLLGLLAQDGSPSSGKGGDLKFGNYGVELKASSIRGTGGFGKIGGQQTTFVKDPAPIISNVQNAMKKFFETAISYVPKNLRSNNNIIALIENYGNASKLQFSVDATWNANANGIGSKEGWSAQTIDSAVITILQTISDVLGEDEKAVSLKTKLIQDYPEMVKNLLVQIWSMWNPSKSTDTVKKLIENYLNPSLTSVLAGDKAMDHKMKVNSKQTYKVNTLLTNYNLFKKAIAFTLLKIYSDSEKFDFIFLINSSDGGRCFVLSKESIGEELESLMNGRDIMPDVSYSTPATFGNPGGQGVQWGIGLA